jgi:hypothetical protein
VNTTSNIFAVKSLFTEKANFFGIFNKFAFHPLFGGSMDTAV